MQITENNEHVSCHLQRVIIHVFTLLSIISIFCLGLCVLDKIGTVVPGRLRIRQAHFHNTQKTLGICHFAFQSY